LTSKARRDLWNVKGIVGLVTDAGVRDGLAVRATGFSVFS
jgi:regulator of RNase E activity RraA